MEKKNTFKLIKWDETFAYNLVYLFCFYDFILFQESLLMCNKLKLQFQNNLYEMWKYILQVNDHFCCPLPFESKFKRNGFCLKQAHPLLL